MRLPSSTFRLQLRNGVDFGTARKIVPKLADLGISHLYLSPIFVASPGSTHGYDITDPTEIDPTLGGEDGYVALAETARQAGMGIILDIVPNHMAFGTATPWLRDVLRHGAESRFANHFDIDWSQRLVLPWLERPFAEMARDGAIRVEGGDMVAGGLGVPLRAGTEHGDVSEVHDAQCWQLTRWERERDSITHRRFFNVTGLIGVRVELPEVFEDVHAKLFELVDRGLVHGIRVDHVDGLSDPADYLHRLRHRVGDVPIWIEKILTGDERLPDWPVEGTTGYEVARQIARALTDPLGLKRLQQAWAAETGKSTSFHEAVITAKGDVIRQELAAELHQLIGLCSAAAHSEGREAGAEALREAIMALLLAVPRYRTYFTADSAVPEDRAIMSAAADTAAEALRSRSVVDQIVRFITQPDSPEARAVQTRFQQVTGALIAKSHEDTAAFRQTAYLAACEVGADPDDATIDAGGMQAWIDRQPATGLSLTSSHDTKRSEDARMRLVAMSHRPGAAMSLLAAATAMADTSKLRAADIWYVAQSALAIWEPSAPELDTRLRDHLVKALREAKAITNWTHPDEEAERPVLDFASRLITRWQDRPAPELEILTNLGAALSLAQVSLKFLLPGIPDIYQSGFGPDFSLTDPDNRRPVDFDRLGDAQARDTFATSKLELTKALLALREREGGTPGPARVTWRQDGARYQIEREHSGALVRCEISLEREATGIRVVANGEPIFERRIADRDGIVATASEVE